MLCIEDCISEKVKVVKHSFFFFFPSIKMHSITSRNTVLKHVMKVINSVNRNIGHTNIRKKTLVSNLKDDICPY